MRRYVYEGPVLLFGICIVNCWKGETMAVSESKARSNLTYQFKRQHNRVAGSKFELPGKIKQID